jgi:hypothetical protein
LQVKGYSLQQDRLEDVAGVEVYVDGTLFDVIHPALYSPAAKAAYPQMDSSNAGFDKAYDFTGVSSGAHTITLRALSMDGGVATQDIAITKGGSGCAPLIADPDPSGTPQDVTDISQPQQPAQPTLGTPRITKAKHTSKGVVSFQVTNLTGVTDSCQLRISASASKNGASVFAKSFSLTSADANRAVSLVANKVSINVKKLKTFYLVARAVCGSNSADSSAVAVRSGTKGNGRLKNVNALAKDLSRKLNRATSGSARRRR